MSLPDDSPSLDPPATTAPVNGQENWRRLARRFEFDRAVFYALAARVWQTIAGPITVILIATYFTPQQQGYYYAFGSLLAVQTLFDLNLNVVLLIGAGHEWVLLRLDQSNRVVGDDHAANRLAGLERFGTQWYVGAALLCLIVIGAVGLWMFRALPASEYAAWIATVAASSAMMSLLPRLAILQGCHQIAAVNKNAASQAVCGSVSVWACILAGLGLWAVAASWFVKLLWDAWLIFRRYGSFFGSLRERRAPHIQWASEIWPLQWRLALQAIAGSIATSSFVLALFHMSSETAAGRMGMSLSVLNMLLWGGQAWVQTRIPTLAGHSRQKDRREYDRLFRKISIMTIIVVTAGAAAFWFVIAGMGAIGLRITERFIDPTAFAVLAVAIGVQHFLNCLTIYARTRQRESFVVPHVVLNIAIAAGVWAAASRFGELGVAVVYAAVLVVFGIPVWLIVWGRERRAWE